MIAFPKFEDGLVRFSLVDENGEETRHAVDSLAATIIADEMVQKHALAIENDRYVFTDAFLSDLAGAFASRFKLPPVSHTVATRIWLASQQEVYGLKKNTSEPSSSAGSTDSTPSSDPLDEGSKSP